MTETVDRSPFRVSRLIAFATLVLVATVSLPPWFPVVAAGGRSKRIAALDGAADAIDPGYIRFLERVAQQADPSASLLIVVPPDLEGPRQGWYLYRAEWVLAGRDLAPFFDPLSGEAQPQRIEKADLLLFWRVEPNLENLQILMREGDGFLLKKR